MKLEDAQLKADAVAKDLIGKEAEHRITNCKYLISGVEPFKTIHDFEVFCVLRPLAPGHGPAYKREEIGFFLKHYKIHNPFLVKQESAFQD